MIVFTLKCAGDHEFETWFRDGAAFERLSAKRAVACPECGDTRVRKAPMAPRVARGGREPEPVAKEGSVRVRRALEVLRKEVEERCEHVGDRFAEEVRRIHYGEAARRNIYGEASDAEAKALAEEGVEFHRIPWVKRGDG